jgi:diaminopimelate epimerase
MCGNGLRCVALHLARERGATTLEATVETDAGPRACSVALKTPSEGDVLVDMGEVRAAGSKTIDIDGTPMTLELGDAGNPHAILFGESSRAQSPMQSAERLGLRIATHPAFPNGTNAGFAKIDGRMIDLVVWERGAGLTLACGTGACAAAVVARTKNLVPAGTVSVRLPGGTLEIDPDPSGRTRMRGPARLVFEGILA